MKITRAKRLELSRRSFLGASLLALTWPQEAFSQLAALGTGPHIVTSHARRGAQTSTTKNWNPDNGGEFKIMDLSSQVSLTIAAPVTAHVYNQHPTRKHLFVGATKHAKGAAVIDLDQNKAVAHVLAPAPYRFYGHGCFNAAGSLFYMTAHSEDLKTGGLCAYDVESWKLQQIYPTGGRKPHDCFWLASGDLIVVHEGAHESDERGCVTQLTRADFQIVKKWDVPIVGHGLEMGPDLLVLSGHESRLPASIVALDLKSGHYRDFRDAAYGGNLKFTGEGLSLCRLSETTVGVTIPEEKKLLMWDLEKKSMEIMPFTHMPVGLAELNGNVYVNDTNCSLLRFAFSERANLLKAPLSSPWIKHFSSGRHLRIALI